MDIKRNNLSLDITFVIPCYNVEKFIVDCIKSIESQKWHNLEYEIICIDDHSTDNTYDTLLEIANKNTRITVLKNEQNRGVSYSRNSGRRLAKGEWIWFVDADDLLANDIVALFITEGNNYTADMVVGMYTYVSSDYCFG